MTSSDEAIFIFDKFFHNLQIIFQRFCIFKSLNEALPKAKVMVQKRNVLGAKSCLLEW